MRRMRRDDSGQLHTMEGVIAGLMMILALTYIFGSITMMSPQTEKTTSVKLTIKAQDALMVIGSTDISWNASSELLRDVAMWNGNIATKDYKFHANEDSISDLNDSLYRMLPSNVFYNVNVTYFDETENRMVSKALIYMGAPQGNSASAWKNIVINYDVDEANPVTSPYWRAMTRPKIVEVRLVLWSI